MAATWAPADGGADEGRALPSWLRGGAVAPRLESKVAGKTGGGRRSLLLLLVETEEVADVVVVVGGASFACCDSCSPLGGGGGGRAGGALLALANSSFRLTGGGGGAFPEEGALGGLLGGCVDAAAAAGEGEAPVPVPATCGIEGTGLANGGTAALVVPGDFWTVGKRSE